jgi:hypothetical protein
VRWIRGYFYSGWAFLVPYLALYLAWYVLKWPVNPGGGFLPSLLHSYWMLHVCHLGLAVLALRNWGGAAAPLVPVPLVPSEDVGCFAVGSRILPLLPWLLLALVLYIPGVYLEWPSDPWMHYWRTTAWSGMMEISSHEFWFKSGYFFAYSFLALVPVDQQSFWVGIYYTAACLLLCWQYFRLGKAVGLDARGAFLFVLLQALLFGNNIFSFYRYYGISTTIFAQIGAVALIRAACEFARECPPGMTAAGGGYTAGRNWVSSLPWRLIVLPAIGLVPLVAFNHAQGLGLIVLGIAAVTIWRILEWKRTWGWYLGVGALILSVAAVICWPRHAAVDQTYRISGMFSPWYGFNIFAYRSPAWSRMMDVVGGIGIANLVAALVLILRVNHLAGWLTITPVLLLNMPFVAIPFAGFLAGRFGHSDDVISFARMFLAIPAGLALVCLGQEVVRARAEGPSRAFVSSAGVRSLAFPAVLVALWALLAVPVAGPWSNRFWNVVAITPADLQLRHVSARLAGMERQRFVDDSGRALITTPAIGYLASMSGIKPASPAGRDFRYQVAANTEVLMGMEARASIDPARLPVLVPMPLQLYSAASMAGRLSGHWLPQTVALDHAASPELERHVLGEVSRPTPGNGGVYRGPGVPADQ